MSPQVSSRRQAGVLFVVAILIALLLAYPAFAKKDRQIDTEGDPGDGNLSPQSLFSGSSSGSTSGGTGSKAFSVSLTDIVGEEFFFQWVFPLPGMPLALPGQALWHHFHSSPENDTAFILFRERGCNHAH